MKLSPSLAALTVLAPLALAGCADKPNPVPTTPKTVESAPEKMALAETTAESAPEDAVTNGTTNATEASTAKPQIYRVRGQVVEVPTGGAFVVVKHEAIPGFMPAMKMRLPLQNAADAAKLKPGDKIAFSMNRDNVQMSNIEKLPPSTALKLSK